MLFYSTSPGHMPYTSIYKKGMSMGQITNGILVFVLGMNFIGLLMKFSGEPNQYNPAYGFILIFWKMEVIILMALFSLWCVCLFIKKCSKEEIETSTQLEKPVQKPLPKTSIPRKKSSSPCQSVPRKPRFGAQQRAVSQPSANPPSAEDLKKRAIFQITGRKEK